MIFDVEEAKKSAIKRLQMEALTARADGVNVGERNVDPVSPREFVCRGTAIRWIKPGR